MMQRRPCPFCAGTNITNGHGSAAMCQDCAAQGPDVRRTRQLGADRNEVLTQAWNRRTASGPRSLPSPAALAAEVHQHDWETSSDEERAQIYLDAIERLQVRGS